MQVDEVPVPQDPDAERSLLATLGGYPDHPEMDEVLQLLHPDAFKATSHRAVYGAIYRMHMANQAIDSLSVKAECEAQGTLERAGGYPGIFDILNGEEVAHPLRLAQRIHEMWARRKAMHAAQRMLQQACDTSVPLEEMTANVLASLDATLPRAASLLTVCGAGEFLDQDPPPPRWLIPGIIPMAVPVVMASKGGVGKSFLSLQLCIALATGKPFLSCPTQAPMGAVYFGLEDDKDTFHRRVRSIIDHYKACQDWLQEDDQHLRSHFFTPFVNWRAKGATAYLPALAANLGKILQGLVEAGVPPGVVIIDTLARVSDGDENTVQALRPVLNSLSLILEFGWSPLVLHHVGKGQDGARTPGTKKPLLADRMSSDWVRGSSAIVDNFRGVLQLTLVNADEAGGAGLDEDKARMGGYAVFGATKINGPNSDWLFIEQDEHGRWFAPKDGIETLAKIRGAKAVAALDKQICILKDLYESTRWGGQADLVGLAKKHYPDKEKSKADAALRQVIFKLRKVGFLQRNSHVPTASGLQQIQVTARVDDEG